MKNWLRWYFGYGVPVLTLLTAIIIFAPHEMDGGEWQIIFIFVPFVNWIPVIVMMLPLTDSAQQTGFIGILFLWAFVGFLLSVADAVREERQEAEENESRQRQEEYRRQQARLAEEENRKKVEQIARARAISDIRDLVSSAQVSAGQLPLILSAANSALETAGKEFKDGLYSPFWEAMEEAVQYLSLFDKTLRSIQSARQRYVREAPALGRDVCDFALGLNILPNPSATAERMVFLYRNAQRDPHFAQIYEQRRTNAILISGFRSLGDALNSLGNRVEEVMGSLASDLGFQLANVEAALQESGQQMQRQQDALLREAEAWRHEAREGQAKMVDLARSNAERADRGAKERRDILLKIQRGEKPSLFS